MLGTIDKVVDNFLYLNLNVDPYKVQNLLNLYVLINDNNKNYIGEIISIDKNIATILLLGEYNNNELFYGIIQKPSLTSAVNIINSNFINKLLSFPNDVSINIAFSPYYDNVPIPACVSSLFGSHMAVIGSSGSGKSNSFTRIVQNLMSNIKNKDNVNFVIFDSYGEYKTAFEYLNDSTDLGFKLYTSNINSSDELLNIPLWFLDIDDYALLLEITQKNQLTIIEKALRNVHIFKNNNENVDAIKNSILSTALLDILLSGKPAAQIRDLITSALSKFNTKDLNLETIISQPGYSRTLRQCLIIDNNNKINAIELLTEFLQKFEFENTNTALPDGSYPYTLEDFAEALDFALIEEGIWKSTKIFDNINILKIRLASLISSEKSKYFDVKDYIDKEDYMKKIFMTNTGKKCQILNFNINYVDDRFAKTLVKIYSKLFYNYAKNLARRGTVPYNLVIEEAHRYVQNDIDIELLGYNIFERIAKEGRKYGVLLSLISQRPCEISATCLSQCSNFLLFKVTHPDDILFLRKIIPNITEEIINQIKIVKPGYGICFGPAFKMPLLIRFEKPNPAPFSESVNLNNLWFT